MVRMPFRALQACRLACLQAPVTGGLAKCLWAAALSGDGPPPCCPPALHPPSTWHIRSLQTRGNQREIDRARAQKRKEKAGVASKDNPDGLTPLQRRERDAKALQEKAAKKAAQDAKK